jgi:hypothetical protein
MFHADVEWRHVHAVTLALKVNAVEEQSRFFFMTMQCEVVTYADAVLESLETSIEMLANCTADELDKRKKCSITAFDHNAATFAVVDAEFEDFESLMCVHFYLLASTNH